MNSQLGMADGWRVLVSESCVRIARNRAKRAQRALQAPLLCFLLYTAVKIGINIQLDMADGWTVLVLESCVRIVSNRMQSVRSELCEHRYRVFCFVKNGRNIQLNMADGWRVLALGSFMRIAHEVCAASFASNV